MASAWGLAWGKSWGNSWGKLDDSYIAFPEPTGGADYYDRMLEARVRWIQSERKRLGLLPKEKRDVFLRKADKQEIHLIPEEYAVYTEHTQFLQEQVDRALQQQVSAEVLRRLDLLQQAILKQILIEERDIMFLLAVLSEL
jgi:hypothetical protein